jgi:hypothetical protein
MQYSHKSMFWDQWKKIMLHSVLDILLLSLIDPLKIKIKLIHLSGDSLLGVYCINPFMAVGLLNQTRMLEPGECFVLSLFKIQNCLLKSQLWYFLFEWFLGYEMPLTMLSIFLRNEHNFEKCLFSSQRI